MTRQENVEQFKAKVNDYEDQCFSLGKAINLAVNPDLPYLHKRLEQGYVKFLIHFTSYKRRILKTAMKTFRNQHYMKQTDSIRQAVKLRKDLFIQIWPTHNIH